MSDTPESQMPLLSRTDIVAKFFRIKNDMIDTKFGRKQKVDWLNQLEVILVYLLQKILLKPQIITPEQMNPEFADIEGKGALERVNSLRPDEVLLEFIQMFTENVTSEDIMFSAEPMIADMLYLIHQDCRYIETKESLKIVEQFDMKRRASAYCDLTLQSRIKKMVQVVDAVRKLLQYLFKAIGRVEYGKTARDFLLEIRNFRRGKMVECMAQERRLRKMSAATLSKLENQDYGRCRLASRSYNDYDDCTYQNY